MLAVLLPSRKKSHRGDGNVDAAGKVGKMIAERAKILALRRCV